MSNSCSLSEGAPLRAGLLALLLAAFLPALAPRGAGAADLPPGAEPVVELLRQSPDDTARLEAVARWAEERTGLAALAAALAERGRTRGDALDLSLAGTLHEAAGRPEDAIEPHEAALAIDPARERSRRALVALLARGGDCARAAALVRDPATLDFATLLLLSAAGEIGGETAARERLAASGLSAAEQTRAARAAGLLPLAAEIAERAGDLGAACELRIAAGELDDARALLARGAAPPPAARLALARLTGDRALLEPALAGRRDPAAEEMRRELARSLGELRAAPAAAPAPPEALSIDDDGTPASSDDPRRAAAHALLAGESDPGARAALAADGPPSLAVAAAWLAAGETERARREVVRWRLAPRPGEERWRAWLARREPGWFGAEASPREWLDRVERAAGPAELGGRAPIDRALLAAEAGSELEAALLFHRDRLFGTGDRARAARIAPHLAVTWPFEGVRAVMPIAAAVDDPRGALAGEIAIPDPLDRAIGRAGERAIRLGSRMPQPERWTIVAWSHEVEDLPPDPGLASSPVAPVTAWLEFDGGFLAVGRGVARHAADGGLIAAMVTPGARTLSATSLDGLVPAGVLESIAELEVEAIAIEGVPSLAAAWRGIVAREALPAGARPEFVRASGATLVLRGGGIRVELTCAPLDIPDRPASMLHHAELSGRFRMTDRDLRRIDRVPSEPLPPASPPPSGPLVIVARTEVPAAHAGAEEVAPFPEARELARAPAEIGRRVHVDAGALTVSISGSGWISGQDDGGVRWWANIEPPLPGLDGWRTARDLSSTGRRGPDLTGPTSDAGVIRGRRLAADRVAVHTDRVLLCDRDGVLPGPDGPAGRTFDRIRDVAEGAGGVWVLPDLGDRLAGERAEIPLGSEGAFDIEAAGDAVWVLGYEPFRVALTLRRVTSAGIETIALPEIAVEEDRAHQRPAALGRWGDQLLIAARGQVWIDDHGSFRPLLPPRELVPELPAHAWQTAPRVAGDTLIVAWPWGEIEEARAP